MSAALILELLPVLIGTVTNLTDLIQRITTDLQQTSELTQAQSDALAAHIKTLEAQPWWQPQQ